MFMNTRYANINLPTAETPSLTMSLNRYVGPLQPGRAALLWGEPLRSLAAAAAAWGVARGAPVFIVDAANRFDPYQLVREARTRGLDPKEALSRTRVARAFTCHQLVRLLKEELARDLTPGSLALLLGPATLFYDEQVPLKERRRLFQEMVDILTMIKSRAPILLLQPLLPQGATNRHFGRVLMAMVDVMGNFGEGPGDHRRGVSPPSRTSPLHPRLREARDRIRLPRPHNKVACSGNTLQKKVSKTPPPLVEGIGERGVGRPSRPPWWRARRPAPLQKFHPHPSSPPSRGRE